ncbi:uncharacterized protein LOC124451889 isoform X1 [Xenia sp. Carnegie-2017]|uniref:uncharacterized protein LOC124451889 isoform X1 n=1 Tax=Xenia sp. Carnegie-2017 TaxID=2897299 RepID=UPI001F039DD1|nr:uncharacterized protein LOC124451889 isoform X1 [Xenia sp. Carnegie-2017]
MEARIKSALSIVVDVWEGKNETYFIDAFKDKLETLRENSSKNLREDSPRNLRESFFFFQDGVEKLKDLEGRAANQPSSSKPETTTLLSQSKPLFEEAGKRAKEAFDDASLSIEDKITASKIHIASAILQHLDNCELATRDLLRCLIELNSSVVAEVTAESQNNLEDEILDSVIHINVNLADFIFKHTNKRMYVMEWPLIQYGKQLIHPFYFKSINEITATPLPWYTTDLRKNIDFFNKKMIVNRKGELLVFDGNQLQRLDSKSGKFQTWCKGRLNVENRQVKCMNVDENGMVYLLLYGKDHPNGNYVLKLCLEDRIVQNCTLHFLNDKNFSKIFLSATPNDSVILATVKSSKRKRSEINIYVCDSKGELINSFVPKVNGKPVDDEVKSLSISSCENIAILANSSGRCYQLIIFTLDKTFVKKIKIHPQVKGINTYTTQVIYTPFDNTIKGFYFKEDKSQLVIETFSIETEKIKIKWSVMLMNTGYYSELFDGLFRLVHHANGKVALLSSESIIYIIKGSSEHDGMEENLEWKETKSSHADTSTTAVMSSEPSGNHDATVMSDVPENSDLWEISEMIYPQWPELARMLGIPEKNLHNICSVNNKLPMEMLLKWKKTEGKNATVNMLFEDLNAFGRRQDECERSDQGCPRQLDDSLPGKLTDEENCYEHHATRQLPTESDLESFRSNVQAFQMLLLWEKEKGKDATRKKLADALISIGRSDLSEKILPGKTRNPVISSSDKEVFSFKNEQSSDKEKSFDGGRLEEMDIRQDADISEEEIFDGILVRDQQTMSLRTKATRLINRSDSLYEQGSNIIPVLSSDMKTNGFKLMRLIVDIGGEALRITLRKQLSGTDLFYFLNDRKNYRKLLSLKDRQIKQHQWDLLYPPPPIFANENKFDITLLCILLRNICGLKPPHDPIWTSVNDRTDDSTEADITRIRLFRNGRFAHLPNTSVSFDEFENHWAEISEPSVRLGISQEEIDRLKNELFGNEEYKRILREWDRLKSDLSDIKTVQRGIKNVVEGIEKDLQQVKDSFTVIKDEVHEIRHHPHLGPEEYFLTKNLVSCNFESEIKHHYEKFLEGTREWVFNEFLAWFEDDTSKNRAFIISAVAGMGKSVIAATLCKRYPQYLTAVHFFRHNNSRYNKANVLLQSLAMQISRKFPPYKQQLVEKLSGKLSQPLNRMNVEGLFSLLFTELFCNISEVPKRMLVVLDALDECGYSERDDLAYLLANHLHKLPPCFRFVITTRPNEVALNMFEKLIPLFINCSDDRNLKDIKFLIDERIGSTDILPDVKNILAEKADGLMLLASLLSSEVKNQDLLNGSIPKDVSEYYEICLTRLSKELDFFHISNEKFQSILNALAVAKEPLPWKMIDDVLCLNSNRMSLGVRKIISCLFVSNEEGCVSFFHESLNDWLLDDRKHDYSVKTSCGHRLVLEFCLKSLDNLKAGGVNYDIIKHASVKYSVKYWLFHLLYISDNECIAGNVANVNYGWL